MRFYVAAMALLGWLALSLQFYLMILGSPAGAWATAATIVSYFSFFTILTNLLVVLTLTFSRWSPNSSWGRFFSRPTVQTAGAVYIVIVGATYSLLLRDLWNPRGAQKVADVLLHDGIPILYAIYWLVFVRKKGLRWRDAFVWLAYPAIYMAYLVVRGAIFGLFPYPFTDFHVLGAARVLVNAALFVLLFWGAGMLAVAMGRWSGRELRAG